MKELSQRAKANLNLRQLEPGNDFESKDLVIGYDHPLTKPLTFTWRGGRKSL